MPLPNMKTSALSFLYRRLINPPKQPEAAPEPTEPVKPVKFDEFAITLKPKDKSSSTLPRRCLDDYIILRELGKGLTSRVYKAKDTWTGQIVALKVMPKTTLLKQAQVDHVRTELEVLRKMVGEKFLVQLKETFSDDLAVYVVQEFIPGGSLYDYLRARRSLLPINTCCFILAETIMALESLHAAGYVYRDLKPENLLITSEGDVKLADLGMTKLLPGTERAYTQCGTLPYMSPEVLKGKGGSFATDLWSLGILAYELMTGHVCPFVGATDKELFSNICHHRINCRWPENMSKTAVDLVLSLLNPKEDERLTLQGVKDHPFFKHVDWTTMSQMKYKPPLEPLQHLGRKVPHAGNRDSSRALR